MAEQAISVAHAEGVLRRVTGELVTATRDRTIVPFGNAFKTFARVPVRDNPDHQLLVQWGTNNFYLNRRTFQLNFTRQFDDPASDEYVQISYTLFFEPSSDLAPLEGSMWSFDYADVDEFFAAVETLDVFTYVRDTHTPFDVRIGSDKT